MGRLKPTLASVPGILAIALRIASSTCFWLRWRSFLGLSEMFSQAWLRCPAPPTQVATFSISGMAVTISSIWRTLASVRSRLLPTGMRSASWVKPWSVSGTNSLPTSGARPSAITKLSTPAPITTPRGVMVALRSWRALLLSRCDWLSKPRAYTGSHTRQRRAEKIQRMARSYTPCSTSMPRSVAAMACRRPHTFFRRVPGGSGQMALSMGSSVKLTNRLTSTATTTVMPKG